VTDTTFIENLDSYTCSHAGQSIDWGMGETICQEEDVPTPEGGK
jgi:hypothetical protein